MRKHISLVWMLISLFWFGGCAPNLVVSNLEENWDETNKKARAEITNVGNRNAGYFLVYFNGDEDPVSPNRRPQVIHNVPGLAKGASVTLNADFASLAHPDNNFLGNVYQITLIADPKNMVKELNENDNTKAVPVSCDTVDSDVATGTTGTIRPGQSFNETRAVDLTVISTTDRVVESLTLNGLNLPGASSALAGARIYDSATQTLVADSDTTVAGGSYDVSVTVPISATLVSGKSYRIGFYIEATPLFTASGNFFEPGSLSDLYNPIAYTEASGIFRINSSHAIGADAFPANPNIFVPQLIIRTRCP